MGIQVALAALASHGEGRPPPPSRWRAIDARLVDLGRGPAAALGPAAPEADLLGRLQLRRTACGDALARRLARVWDSASGRELATLRHPQPINYAEFADTGQRVLTRAADGTVRLWDVATAAELAVLPLLEGEALRALSPDARTILTTAKTGPARVGMPRTATSCWSC